MVREVALFGLLVSGTTAPTAVAALIAIVLIRYKDEGRSDSAERLIRWLILVLIVNLVYFSIYLNPIVPDSMREYWSSYLTDTDSIRSLAASLISQSIDASKSLLMFHELLWAILASTTILLKRWRELVIVTMPLVATIAASSAQLMPFGGGRIDIHLLPVLVIVVALIVDESVRVSPLIGMVVGILVVLSTLIVGFMRYEKPHYNNQDIRPLVAMMQEEIDHESSSEYAVLVYPSARYGFSLYTRASVHILPDRTSPNGFTVNVDDPRITILNPAVNEPAAHLETVRTSVSGKTDVWYIGTFFKEDDAVIASRIDNQGFIELYRREAQGARLIRYLRLPDDNGL